MAFPAGILAKNSKLWHKSKSAKKKNNTPEFLYEGVVHPKVKTQSLSTFQNKFPASWGDRRNECCSRNVSCTKRLWVDKEWIVIFSRTVPFCSAGLCDMMCCRHLNCSTIFCFHSDSQPWYSDLQRGRVASSPVPTRSQEVRQWGITQPSSRVVWMC